MQIKLLVDGGNMQPGPTLSQKIGPLGINMGQIIQKVNDTTKNFKGMKVPVEININPSTKEIDIRVFSPPVSELLKKELGVEKGSGEQKKIKIANASIEEIILIAKNKFPNLLSKDLKAAVKTILGSCVSLGILVENKDPREIIREINEGKYDQEISKELTITPAEKKIELEKFFSKIREQQEKIKQQEEVAKAALLQQQVVVAGVVSSTESGKTAEKKVEEITMAAEKSKKERSDAGSTKKIKEKK